MRFSRIAAAAALITVAAVGSPGLPATAARPATTVAGWHGLGAAAVPPFGPKTVVMTDCALPRPSSYPPNAVDPPSVVTATGPTGGVYGFASCRPSTPGAMYFFSSKSGLSSHELAPYRGTLETMASDGTGAMYLCYSVRSANDTWIYLARRSAQGTYSPPTLITHTVGTFRPQATLAAAPGRWWLVWSEAISAEPSATHVLYERRTMLGIRLRHQITFSHTNLSSDGAPSLAVQGPLARLAWLRGPLDGVMPPGQAITHLLPNGTWSLCYFLGGRFVESWTRMVISEGRTYLVYPGAVFVDNGTGHFLSQPGLEPLGRTALAVSAGVATIATPQLRVWQPYVELHELRSGTWSSAQWQTFDSFDAVVSRNGHATLVMHKQTTPMLYLVTER